MTKFLAYKITVPFLAHLVIELKKRLVEVWSRTLSTLLPTNEECISLSVCGYTNGRYFEYLLLVIAQLDIGYTVSRSARNLAKMC